MGLESPPALSHRTPPLDIPQSWREPMRICREALAGRQSAPRYPRSLQASRIPACLTPPAAGTVLARPPCRPTPRINRSVRCRSQKPCPDRAADLALAAARVAGRALRWPFPDHLGAQATEPHRIRYRLLARQVFSS